MKRVLLLCFGLFSLLGTAALALSDYFHPNLGFELVGSDALIAPADVDPFHAHFDDVMCLVSDPPGTRSQAAQLKRIEPTFQAAAVKPAGPKVVAKSDSGRSYAIV